MEKYIDRAELFNKLAPVQTLGEAYAVIQSMTGVDIEHREELAYLKGKTDGIRECTEHLHATLNLFQGEKNDR